MESGPIRQDFTSRAKQWPSKIFNNVIVSNIALIPIQIVNWNQIT